MVKKILRILREKKKKNNLNRMIARGMIVGKNFNNYGAYLDYGSCFLIEIGNNVTLTSGCSILTHDASTRLAVGMTKVGKVKIGNNVFIGYGSIVLPDSEIGDNIIIGAGSVVTSGSRIPSNSIAAGNPCRVISTFDTFKKKHEKNLKDHPVFDEYWANKSIEDITKEKQLLSNFFGYDKK